MRRLVFAALTTAGVVAALAVAPARGAVLTGAGSSNYEFCPSAKTFIGPNTSWTRHRLSPAVTLLGTTVHFRGERVDINVVAVDLTKPGAVVAPLRHALTVRRKLTSLAAHRRLVAATNGMYFSYAFGAPTVPLITSNRPVIISSVPQPVAGLSVNHVAQGGDVWLVGHVSSVGGTLPLAAINEVAPPAGLTIYTGSWGPHRVPLPPNSRSRAIQNGRILPGGGRPRFVPTGGRLLVANGAAAVAWLKSLPRPSAIAASWHVETDAAAAFSQAYGVGTEVVAAPGEVRDGLYCQRGEIYAARTTIGWRNNGHVLMLVTVESRRASDNHGFDENQMSGVLVALGASQAFALDGGGSTELVARMPGHKKLSIPTLNPNGKQREIPVGIGIYK
jgi:hypothetical protein